MSTADGEGIVDSALFTPGLVMENDQIVFVMLDRLIHRNLQSNPNAMFLFMEDTPGYIGKRLSLTKINESTDRSLVERIVKECNIPLMDSEEKKYAVVFKINKVLPLVTLNRCENA